MTVELEETSYSSRMSATVIVLHCTPVLYKLTLVSGTRPYQVSGSESDPIPSFESGTRPHLVSRTFPRVDIPLLPTINRP